MQVLLTDIELDIQELKCLTNAFAHEPNTALREVIKRNILQMRGRLDALLLELDAVVPINEPKRIEEVKASSPVIVPDEPIVDAVEPIIEKPEAAPVPVLGERIKSGAELCSSISLNDSFRFSRELFDGDVAKMNRVLQQIGEMSSYSAALSFFTSKVKVSEENEAMADLQELLKKYFN